MAQALSFGLLIRAREAVDARFHHAGRPWENTNIVLSAGDNSSHLAYPGLFAVDTTDNTLWILSDLTMVAVEAGWTQFEGGGGVQVYADNTAYEVGDLVRVGTDQIYMVRVAVADTNTDDPVDGPNWLLLDRPDVSSIVVDTETDLVFELGADTAVTTVGENFFTLFFDSVNAARNFMSAIGIDAASGNNAAIINLRFIRPSDGMMVDVAVPANTFFIGPSGNTATVTFGIPLADLTLTVDDVTLIQDDDSTVTIRNITVHRLREDVQLAAGNNLTVAVNDVTNTVTFNAEQGIASGATFPATADADDLFYLTAQANYPGNTAMAATRGLYVFKSGEWQAVEGAVNHGPEFPPTEHRNEGSLFFLEERYSSSGGLGTVVHPPGLYRFVETGGTPDIELISLQDLQMRNLGFTGDATFQLRTTGSVITGGGTSYTIDFQQANQIQEVARSFGVTMQVLGRGIGGPTTIAANVTFTYSDNTTEDITFPVGTLFNSRPILGPNITRVELTLPAAPTGGLATFLGNTDTLLNGGTFNLQNVRTIVTGTVQLISDSLTLSNINGNLDIEAPRILSGTAVLDATNPANPVNGDYYLDRTLDILYGPFDSTLTRDAASTFGFQHATPFRDADTTTITFENPGANIPTVPATFNLATAGDVIEFVAPGSIDIRFENATNAQGFITALTGSTTGSGTTAVNVVVNFDATTPIFITIPSGTTLTQGTGATDNEVGFTSVDAFPADTTPANYQAVTVSPIITTVIEDIMTGGVIEAGTNITITRVGENAVSINAVTIDPTNAQVSAALGISPNGSPVEFLNQQGNFVFQHPGTYLRGNNVVEGSETYTFERIDAMVDPFDVIDPSQTGVPSGRTQVQIGFQTANQALNFAHHHLGVPNFEENVSTTLAFNLNLGSGMNGFPTDANLTAISIPVGTNVNVQNFSVNPDGAKGIIILNFANQTNDWWTNRDAINAITGTPSLTLDYRTEVTANPQVIGPGRIQLDNTMRIHDNMVGVDTAVIADATQDFSVGDAGAVAGFTFDSIATAAGETSITFANRAAANMFWQGLGRADALSAGTSNVVTFNNNRSTEYTLTVGTTTSSLNAVVATFPAQPSAVITFASDLMFGDVGTSGTINVNRPLVNFETGNRPLNLNGDAPVAINDINISRNGDQVTFTNPNPLQFAVPGTAGNVVVDWAQAGSTEPIPTDRLGLSLGQVYTLDVSVIADTVTVHDAMDEDTRIPLALLRFTPTQNMNQWEQGDLAVITDISDPANVSSLGTFLYTGTAGVSPTIGTVTASADSITDTVLITNDSSAFTVGDTFYLTRSTLTGADADAFTRVPRTVDNIVSATEVEFSPGVATLGGDVAVTSTTAVTDFRRIERTDVVTSLAGTNGLTANPRVGNVVVTNNERLQANVAAPITREQTDPVNYILRGNSSYAEGGVAPAQWIEQNQAVREALNFPTTDPSPSRFLNEQGNFETSAPANLTDILDVEENPTNAQFLVADVPADPTMPTQFVWQDRPTLTVGTITAGQGIEGGSVGDPPVRVAIDEDSRLRFVQPTGTTGTNAQVLSTLDPSDYRIRVTTSGTSSAVGGGMGATTPDGAEYEMSTFGYTAPATLPQNERITIDLPDSNPGLNRRNDEFQLNPYVTQFIGNAQRAQNARAINWQSTAFANTYVWTPERIHGGYRVATVDSQDTGTPLIGALRYDVNTGILRWTTNEAEGGQSQIYHLRDAGNTDASQDTYMVYVTTNGLTSLTNPNAFVNVAPFGSGATNYRRGAGALEAARIFPSSNQVGDFGTNNSGHGSWVFIRKAVIRNTGTAPANHNQRIFDAADIAAINNGGRLDNWFLASRIGMNVANPLANRATFRTRWSGQAPVSGGIRKLPTWNGAATANEATPLYFDGTDGTPINPNTNAVRVDPQQLQRQLAFAGDYVGVTSTTDTTVGALSFTIPIINDGTDVYDPYEFVANAGNTDHQAPGTLMTDVMEGLRDYLNNQATTRNIMVTDSTGATVVEQWTLGGTADATTRSITTNRAAETFQFGNAVVNNGAPAVWTGTVTLNVTMDFNATSENPDRWVIQYWGAQGRRAAAIEQGVIESAAVPVYETNSFEIPSSLSTQQNFTEITASLQGAVDEFNNGLDNAVSFIRLYVNPTSVGVVDAGFTIPQIAPSAGSIGIQSINHSATDSLVITTTKTGAAPQLTATQEHLRRGTVLRSNVWIQEFDANDVSPDPPIVAGLLRFPDADVNIVHEAGTDIVTVDVMTGTTDGGAGSVDTSDMPAGFAANVETYAYKIASTGRFVPSVAGALNPSTSTQNIRITNTATVAVATQSTFTLSETALPPAQSGATVSVDGTALEATQFIVTAGDITLITPATMGQTVVITFLASRALQVIHYNNVLETNSSDWYEWLGVRLSGTSTSRLRQGTEFAEDTAGSVYSTSNTTPFAATATTIHAF